MGERFFSLDIETYDPYLKEKGPSWVYGVGEILVCGLYNCSTKQAHTIDGHRDVSLRNLFLSADTVFIGANIAYDFGWLCYANDISVQETKCSLIDVQVAESFIDEYQLYTLDALVQKYLQETKKSNDLVRICQSLGLKKDFRHNLHTLWYWDKDLKIRNTYRNLIRSYVKDDARQAALVWAKQKVILEQQETLPAFYMNMKMVKVTCKMKQHGVRVDYDRWKQNCVFVEKIQKKLEDKFKHTWGKVNIRSSKQLGDFMLKHSVPFKWRITIRGRTNTNKKFCVKTDSFSVGVLWEEYKTLKDHFPTARVEKNKLCLYVDTVHKDRTVLQLNKLGYDIVVCPNIDKFWMRDMKDRHAVVADLVEYKQVTNIISKFLGPKFERFLVYYKNEKEWRIHGTFNVVGARQTGRLSATMPNLQNIPVKVVLFEGTKHVVDLALLCREIFLPDKGHILAKLDFSGQENILQAHFAVGNNGKFARSLYEKNARFDEHQFVATESGLEAEYGRKIGRKYAKNVRFGISYGMQITRMCLQFHWEKIFAEKLRDAINDAAPWVIETMAAVQQKVLKVGYIKTLLGRRIHIADKKSKKTYPFYNYLIQGSAADQLKSCQVACDETQTVEHLLLTVHDEGIFSLPMTREGLQRLKELQKIHETCVQLRVPVICDPEIGSDWAHTEGQRVWTEEDVEKGLCDKAKIKYPKESIDMLWKRVIRTVKNNKQSKARVLDSVVEDKDEEEEY